MWNNLDGKSLKIFTNTILVHKAKKSKQISPAKGVHDAKELRNFSSSKQVCQRSGSGAEHDAGGESGDVEHGDVRLAEAVVVVKLETK